MAIPFRNDEPALSACCILPHLIHQAVFRLAPTPEFGDGDVRAVLITGNDRTDAEKLSGHVFDSADPAAVLEVIKRVHVEHDGGAADHFVKPTVHCFKAAALRKLICCPDGDQRTCDRDVECIHRPDVQTELIGFRHHANCIVGAGQFIGYAEDEDILEAFFFQPLHQLHDISGGRRGGCRDLAREPSVNHHRIDIDSIQIFLLRIANLEGKKPDVIFLAEFRGHIAAGIYNHSGFLFVHLSVSFVHVPGG